MEIYIDNIKLEEAAGEKLLEVVIDSNLSWNLHIDYLIKKTNSRICLLKRAKAHLTFACRKMLYNALIKPILEYCCTLHKINQGHCPTYFNNYIEYISNTHNYNTRSVSNKRKVCKSL